MKLHSKQKMINRYKYCVYDITSPTRKILNTNKNECVSDWILESLFTPIDTAIADDAALTSRIIELLKWKICREDYLMKHMNTIKLQLSKHGKKSKKNRKKK
eukprot:262643_1